MEEDGVELVVGRVVENRDSGWMEELKKCGDERNMVVVMGDKGLKREWGEWRLVKKVVKKKWGMMGLEV